MKNKQLLAAATVLLLAGCGSNDGPHGGHTSAWYNKHPEQTIKEIKWCNTHMATVQKHNAAMNSCRSALTSAPAFKYDMQREQKLLKNSGL